MNNQRGFILPYTLFIATIVLLIVMTNIITYNQNIQITYNYMEQIKIQTLFQMGREKFKQEVTTLEINNKVAYDFPHGHVVIDYTTTETEYHLYFLIYTENDSVYLTENTLKIPLDET